MAKYLDATGLTQVWTKAKETFAVSGHTHSYLPLSGGTLTGNGASLIIGQSAGSPGVSTARKLRLGLGTVGHTGSQYWAFCVDDTTSSSYLQIGYTESDKSISIRHDGYIAVGKVDPSYRVDISGSLNATTLYQNGTAVSVDGHTHSYLPLSGGSLSGAIIIKGSRLTTSGGAPYDFRYSAGVRGTGIYSNGIAFADDQRADPTNNDFAWIRHLEDTANNGLLEIAVGDDGDTTETIHFRWYNTSNTISYDSVLQRKSGTIALTSDIPTVYDWAKASTKPTYTYSEVGAAAASHTHTSISSVDQRSKYPGQIASSAQSISCSFMQNSTIGVSGHGTYSDAIIVRGYMDSSGGYDNAIIFNKNENSVMHSQFNFGSTSSWGNTYIFLDSNNYTSYCAPASHTHSYLPLSGGTLSGDIHISHGTTATMDNTTTNPKIIFSESGSQAVGLVYTDYDSYRPSKGLKVVDVDGSDAGNVWFEAQGNIYSAGFVHRSYNSASYLLLSNGGVKAVSDFVDSSSLGTAASKDSTTIVSSGNGSLITSGAVYDYIETYIAPSRYETVTVTCITDEEGVSMYGGTITIDEVTYTIPSDGIVTAQVTDGRTYSIIPGQKSGYVAPAEQTITAVNGRTRNLTLIWTKIVYGVYIYYSDGSISSYNDFRSAKTPAGVWLYNSNVSFIINPNEGSGTWSKDYGPRNQIHSYSITASSNNSVPSQAKTDYGGKRNTTSSNSSRRGTAFSGAINTTWQKSGLVGYLPSCGEMEQIRLNLTNINIALELIGGTKIDFSQQYWSSTQVRYYYSTDSEYWYFGPYLQGSTWSARWLEGSNSKKYRAVSELPAS